MWKFIKQMPLVPKIILAILILGVVGKLTTLGDHARHSGFEPVAFNTTGPEASAANDSDRRRLLAQYQAQQAQLVSQMQRCQQEMNRVTQQMQQAAISGSGMMPPPPPCEQNMPAWISQEALMETEIYRLQTGDNKSTVREVTGIPSNSGSSSSRSSSSGSNDGTSAVEDWDRGAIRGTSRYTDEDGKEYELKTESYYYRDRNSGEIIGSERPDPPNDGRDYEQLQPVPFGQPQ